VPVLGLALSRLSPEQDATLPASHRDDVGRGLCLKTRLKVTAAELMSGKMA
jgi:hypothetical protein